MTKHWFRERQGLLSKDLGWGFTPISWEGWVSTAVLLGVVLLLAYVTKINKNPAILTQGIEFVIGLLIVIVLFWVFAKERCID